jgi:penicillin G amidase
MILTSLLRRLTLHIRGKYFFNGNWMEMEERREIIRVKGGDEVERSIMFTHRGPVISGMRGINDAVLTMRWSGYDLSDEVNTVYRLNRAHRGVISGMP